MNKEFDEWYENKYPRTVRCNEQKAHFYGYETLKEAYEAGQQSAKPRWIPVKKRLPTKDDGQTYYKNRQMYVDVLCRWKNKSITLETFNLDGNFFCIPDYSIIYLISWQPLPEA